MKEVHEGDCGNHAGCRSTVLKVLRLGYYWPTIYKDLVEMARRCEQCQKHAPSIVRSLEELSSVVFLWLLMKWGMDIVGPLPMTLAQKNFLLVLMDYYSKWITTDAYASIKDKDVRMFVWKHIIFQFGVLKKVVTDNGSQFSTNEFREFCKY